MSDNQYKLDRSHVSSMTFEEADDYTTYRLDKREDERLNAACFLINQLYDIIPYTKVYRTITDHRKLCDD